jgi:L-alanine-DL-glutamate epimerase-like enolase superfamily enzyme
MDILLFDPALAYGLVEYQRILGMLATAGWSARSCIPHGGNQMSLHAAAGFGLGGSEAYPGVFPPFGGFGDGVRVEGGRLHLPEVPGIGIEHKADLYRVFQELAR